jgi:hypothetical protein
MNQHGRMNTLPDFVTDREEEGRLALSSHVVLLTGWETVVFQLDDEEEPGSDSVFSTAALAP